MSVESRDYVTRSASHPVGVRRGGDCLRSVFEALTDSLRLDTLELFGGVGRCTRILAELGVLRGHEIWDNAPACVSHLRSQFPASAVREVDAFTTPITGEWDLICADFNTWTFRKFVEDPRYKTVTDRIFDHEPEYVQITDSAVGWVHLNGNVYSDLGLLFGSSGSFDTPQDYLTNVAAILCEEYGYSVAAMAYHSRAGYTLYSREQRHTTMPAPIFIS